MVISRSLKVISTMITPTFNFVGHDKNIEGYYDANHIYTSPIYRYESNTYL